MYMKKVLRNKGRYPEMLLNPQKKRKRLLAYLVTISFLLALPVSSRSESASPVVSEILQFDTLLNDVPNAPRISAAFRGAERFQVAWRYGKEQSARLSVTADSVVYYRTKGFLQAVLSTGEPYPIPASKERPYDYRDTIPGEYQLEESSVSGMSANGESWIYSLPKGRFLMKDSVQSDGNGNLYFHDNHSDWYSLDAGGGERYVLQWSGDWGDAVCRSTPSGDAVCASASIGLFGIRERSDAPRLYVDGKELVGTIRPIIREGLTYVPFRSLFEAIGAEIRWHEDTRSVEAERNGAVVRLTIDSREAQAGGRTILLSAPPMLINGRTMIPLRFAGEALGARVIWEAPTRTIQIALP
jgi:hypothetical protein